MRPHNLPVPRAPLIGRERELTTLLQRLMRDDVALLTLTGPGGTGKTRLGLQVAVEVVEHFVDGAVFVPLAPIRESALVPSALARALGVQESTGRPLADVVRDHLRDKELLLVLDNFEQVLEAGPFLVELLRACRRLKILVTSRAVLRVSEESGYPVPPLSLPEQATPPTADHAAQAEAVRLFVERARAVRPDFRLTDQNAATVADICRRLDGLPLAIELAAARVRHLPPPAILARLEHRLALLTGGPQDLPPRQQTLRATIAWSYDLLNETEQALFRRLSVFVGGCTLGALGAVCLANGGSVGGRPVVVDGLDGAALLVDRSLLRREDQDEGEPRFWMLETIREFGQEQLEAAGEAPLTRHRHAAYYLALAEEAAPGLHAHEQRRWLAHLDREHPNLRAALAWSRSEPEMLELWTRLGAALGWFWWLHGDWSEGRQWLEAVESSAADDGRGRVPRVVRARALNRAAHLARGQGDYDRAKALAELGLRHAQDAADRREIAWCRLARAAIALDQVEYEYGVELSNEAAAIGRQIGDAWVTALALYFLGFMARGRGEFERATAFHHESLALRRRIGDAWGMSWSVHDLGLVALEQGDHRRARTLLEEGLALHRELNHRRGVGWSLNDLGVAALVTGNVGEARALLHGSLTVRREQGDKRGIAEGLEALAGLARAQGQAVRAARLLAAAAALREAIGLTLWPIERDRHDREVAAVRGGLKGDAFASAWADGRAMTLDDAVAYALATEASGGEPERLAGTNSPGRGADPLTAREREVAILVARGCSNRRIAEELIIAQRTAENHVAHICNKLGLSSRAQIAAWAVQRGLLADGSSSSATREPPSI